MLNHPLPKRHGHHLGHVHTEAVDILAAPITEDTQHLLPSIALIVVQFDCVVPIVKARIGSKDIVACRLGGKLLIRLFRDPSRRHKTLSIAIIEIAGIKTLVLSCQVIGDEIHDDFHSFRMDTLDQSLKVGHRTQIRIQGSVIRDGVGRARSALGNIGMRTRRFRGVLQDTRQPDMGKAQVFNRVKGRIVNIVESAAAVFGLATIEMEFGLLVAKQAGEKLIDVHTAKLLNL